MAREVVLIWTWTEDQRTDIPVLYSSQVYKVIIPFSKDCTLLDCSVKIMTCDTNLSTLRSLSMQVLLPLCVGQMVLHSPHTITDWAGLWFTFDRMWFLSSIKDGKRPSPSPLSERLEHEWSLKMENQCRETAWRRRRRWRNAFYGGLE